MATNGIKSDSVCMMPDGTIRRIDSLTEEEHAAFVERCRVRMERALQDYINTHPGSFEQIKEALRKLREEKKENELNELKEAFKQRRKTNAAR